MLLDFELVLVKNEKEKFWFVIPLSIDTELKNLHSVSQCCNAFRFPSY